jgi:S-DNA-T family DNA segregation ATPase FtsK/SpoIIIE
MTSVSADTQREMVRRLVDKTGACAAEQTRLDATIEAERVATKDRFAQRKEEIERRLDTATKETEAAHQSEVSQLESRAVEERQAADLEYKTQRNRVVEQAGEVERKTKSEFEKAKWLAESVFESAEPMPRRKFEQTKGTLDSGLKKLNELEKELADLLVLYRFRPSADPGAETPVDDATLAPGEADVTSFEAILDDSRQRLNGLKGLGIAQLYVGGKAYFLAFALATLIIGGVAYLSDWRVSPAVIGTGIAAVFVLTVVSVLGRRLALKSIRTRQEPLRELLHRGYLVYHQTLTLAAETRQREEAEIRETRDREVSEAKAERDRIMGQVQPRRDQELARLNEVYKKRLADQRDRHDRASARADEQYRQQISRLNEEHRRDTLFAEQEREHRLDEIQREEEQAWAELERTWREDVIPAYESVQEQQTTTRDRFPAWDDDSWTTWTPAPDFPRAIRFGSLDVDLASLPRGIPEHPKLLLPGPPTFKAPALARFPEDCSILVEYDGADRRDQAVAILQMLMLRLLTSLPPGKLRFTMIDPVGLGQSFAGFMHLADYDEAFVSGKIWTESRHIEQRLADLSEHMEHVIQKYLRNEFETIEAYNEYADEIAEPFRFLVIADFPVNFNESACRRLSSILASGARCGVHTLFALDRRQAPPAAFQLDDARSRCLRLVCGEKAVSWDDPDLGSFALDVDDAPPDEVLTSLLHKVGAAAKAAGPVQVPFKMVAPSDDETWTSPAAEELRIPLGRAGASKLQYMTLGKGTSQHVLIAGKTGSGKSTLLHALIMGAAAWYSPDEVELYLVDFKKGVEFKTYAAHELPHARVVAIESDREFGLSVLQKLDAELKRRGDLFRNEGVQDLAAYHRLPDHERMPRILLIVDEFQEFFTEDDKVGQDAALLLDRLVRQGRAFGMHILLGSQTLAGAYTLARSTIGQMAVRIALQCSETDSYLIMSDDNSAARLLARPGEAIYNDASGAVEGNSPFQVTWIPDIERDAWLRRIQELRDRLEINGAYQQIVFEGNIPADLRRNVLLARHLAAPTWAEQPVAPLAWLGEAIAIKDPTAVTFRRQGGSNLLIVGQRDDAAGAMLATSVISLAAQVAPSAARFMVLDGTPPDSPLAGLLSGALEHLPHDCRFVDWRSVDESLAEVAAELSRRQDAEQADAQSIYVLVNGLHRFRALRRSEDDFGFSMGDEDKPPRADKLLADILRDGPAYGIHTMIWADTVNTLDRMLDRMALREFEHRVLFQMSSADSSHLVDSPIAAKLGLKRALYYSEEYGQPEKFRPYAIPGNEWLAKLGNRLSARPIG